MVVEVEKVFVEKMRNTLLWKIRINIFFNSFF